MIYNRTAQSITIIEERLSAGIWKSDGLLMARLRSVSLHPARPILEVHRTSPARVRNVENDPKPTLMGSTGRRKADIRGAPELVEFFELVRRRGDCLTRGAAAAASLLSSLRRDLWNQRKGQRQAAARRATVRQPQWSRSGSTPREPSRAVSTPECRSRSSPVLNWQRWRSAQP